MVDRDINPRPTSLVCLDFLSPLLSFLLRAERWTLVLPACPLCLYLCLCLYLPLPLPLLLPVPLPMPLPMPLPLPPPLPLLLPLPLPLAFTLLPWIRLCLSFLLRARTISFFCQVRYIPPFENRHDIYIYICIYSITCILCSIRAFYDNNIRLAF